MRIIRYSVLTGIFLLATACNKSSNSGGGSETPAPAPTSASTPASSGTTDSKTNTKVDKTFSYEFEHQECKTGKQTFKTEAELCNGLRDSALNNNCALEMRANHFKENNCPTPVGKSYALQITALNFLSGGLELCDLKDKIFSFSTEDMNPEIVICANSRVKLYAVSDSGTVTFHAVGLLSGRELLAKDISGNGRKIELGRGEVTIKTTFENPFGFTYIMAEDVTGIDPQLLAQWNRLRDQYTELKGQVLTAESQGKRAPAKVLEKLKSLKNELNSVADRMVATRNRS